MIRERANTLRSRESREGSLSPKNKAEKKSLTITEVMPPIPSLSTSRTNSMESTSASSKSFENEKLVSPSTPNGKRSDTSGGGDSGSSASSSTAISATGLKVLILLAVQNCSKNLLLRFVMKEHPKFLTSAAILGVEGVKLLLSLIYIVVVQRRPATSAITFIRQDKRNTMLMAVPATLYSVQMTLEYIALSNIDASVFSVLVQCKLLATAGCAVFILGRSIKKVQMISLVLLTIGVMLCNMKSYGTSAPSEMEEGAMEGDETKGVIATLGISACSGFASVYTEKVIKAKRNIKGNDSAQLPAQQQQVQQPNANEWGLAYTQVQLAFVSLLIMGSYCLVMELDVIWEKGLFYGFNGPAVISIFVSAIGGLIVAAVLKFADAVLKGYATAISVILTGVLSTVLFGTHLNTLYYLGIGNVICAVFLYSAKDLDRLLC